jgi:hypothetical protein
MSGGAPDSVRCARLDSSEKAALGKNRRRTAIIHPTVRWCTGLSGEPTVTSATVGHAIHGRRVAAPTVGRGHRTVRYAPDSVRCANCPGDAMVFCARKGRRSAPDCLQWLSGGRPDCSVCHSTEGKDGLPCWSSTAPSYLGAIKGTHRRIEELPKLTRNILRLQDSNFTHSIPWDSDLSSIWVVNSVRCVLSSSCDLCAWLCCGFETCVCCSPLPYFCASVVIIIVRARGSKLWRFLANGRKTKKGKTVVFKLIIGSLERGWVQPSSIGTPQRGSRQVLLGRTMG